MSVDFLLFRLAKPMRNIEKAVLYVHNSRKKLWTMTEYEKESTTLYLTFNCKNI